MNIEELAREWFLLEDINAIGMDQLQGFTNAVIEAHKSELKTQNAALVEALNKLSLYVAHNGDDWVQREARAALAKIGETK